MAPTIPVYTLGLPELLRTAAMSGLAAPALARFRADVARSRSDDPDDFDARSTNVVIGPGDSNTEAYAPGARGRMWTRYLARRLNGQRLASVQFVPASSSTLNVQDQWPGAQPPWAYSAVPAGDVLHGPDLHAVVMQSGSTATLSFFGEVVTVVYAKTPAGPAAAAVTLDGIAQGALAAQGPDQPGQQQPYVADGYGFHTLVVTSTAGQLTLEGAVVADNEPNIFGTGIRAVRTFAFGHAGFQANDYLVRPHWSTSLLNVVANVPTGTYPSLFIIPLGANEQGAGVPAQQFEDNLLSIVSTLDQGLDALGVTTDPGFLFLAVPALQDQYVEAMWSAAGRYGTERCSVLDSRYFLPRGGVDLDIFNNGGHLNDAGQFWLAELVAGFIDGHTATTAPRPLHNQRQDIVIDALTPAAFRTAAWVEAFTTVPTSGQTYDATPATAVVHERRHRGWFDRGTYQVQLTYVGSGAAPTVDVLVGGVSLTAGAGTVLSTTVDQTFRTAAPFAQVTVDSPGARPIVVRKHSNNANALRFSELFVRKVS